MELHEGRPDSIEGRTAPEIRTYDTLDRLGIHYWQTDHKQAANTMEDCLEVDSILNATICKNLFLCNRQKTNFYLLMMPGEKKFLTKELSHQIGSARLSFAPEDKMVEFLDIHPGAVSVMGLMNDKDNNVSLYIDKEVLDSEFIGCHPCINTSSLRMKTADIVEKFLPAVHHEFTVVEMPYDENEE